MNSERIAEAEARVKQKAAKIAYQLSDRFDESDMQSILFNIYRESIILGARMMQEELLNLEDDEN